MAKLRGSKFRGGEHDFRLDTGGISVFPRLSAADHRGPLEHALRSTGHAVLDRMLGGGLTRGSNTLFAGPSGVGKTTTAIACTLAALQRGEKASYYLFDEGMGTLLTRCRLLGLPLDQYL